MPANTIEKRCGSRVAGAASLFCRMAPAIAMALLLFFSRSGAAHAEKTCTPEDMRAIAVESRLFDDKYWHILLHYERKLFGIESQIDDPRFFLAEDGKTNPRAELEATIEYLFRPDADEKATCRFYARFHWLKENLGEAFPECFSGRSCPSTDEISPRAASLVFPTYYMNNPASMFGHTLLLIDTAYSNKRLSNAVNFAAFTEGNDGMQLVVSGLTGLFKGYYSVMPYYVKIQEYSDINQRDIWEYELNLTPEELQRMVRHVREMDKIYSDYYFFDENCSYSLLYLIEAARPSVRLTDRFRLATIPIDTVKAVKEEGLIAGVSYRPSRATRIDHLVDSMDPSEVQTVLGLIDGRIDPAVLLDEEKTREERIRILDLAAEVIQYRYVSKEIDQSDYRKQLLSVLKVRSRLGSTEKDRNEDIPAPPQPEQGHDSARLSFGPGVRDEKAFVELRFRAALTDLADMDYIPNQGAQIEFGDLRGRYYPEDRRLALEQFDLIDIVSLSPVDAFFRPFSWMVNTGWHRKPIQEDDDELYYRVNGGAGYSARFDRLGMTYLMGEAEVDLGGKFDSDYALGAGMRMGTVLPVGSFCRIHLYGRALRFFEGDEHTLYAAGGLANFRISTNNHLSFGIDFTEVDPFEIWEASVMWNFFF